MHAKTDWSPIPRAARWIAESPSFSCFVISASVVFADVILRAPRLCFMSNRAALAYACASNSCLFHSRMTSRLQPPL